MYSKLKHQLFSNENPGKFFPYSAIPVFSLYDSIEQLVNSSSKFDISASDDKIGTNGDLIDFVNKAFQFTLSNQGWFFIYSDPLFPSLSLGFFYNNLINKFWSLGDA